MSHNNMATMQKKKSKNYSTRQEAVIQMTVVLAWKK